MKKNLTYILFMLGLSACLEPFNPNIPDSEKRFIVVEGMINDGPGPYLISLKYHGKRKEDETPVKGATIVLESQNGEKETLTEVIDGFFLISNIKGVAGESYKINISHEGNNYESTWEKLESSPEIDSIYYQHEIKETTDKEEQIEGLQFYITSSGNENNSQYLRFVWDESWKFMVRWPIRYNYIGNDEFTPKRDDFFHTCWKHNSSQQINLASTNTLSENTLFNHKLGFIQGEEERYSLRYSIEVFQYGLNENEYIFWEKLRESNQEGGNLFDKQPATIRGNISNTNNPGDIVLGYFSAVSVKRKRIYIDWTDLPDTVRPRPKCLEVDSIPKSDFEDPNDYEKHISDRINTGSYFFEFMYTLFGDIIGAVIVRPSCADCREQGGTLTEPFFWEDED